MAAKRFIFAILLAIPAFISSCGPDKEDPGTTIVPAPTAYDIKADIPNGWSQNVHLPADNPLTNEGIELGRFLFYEKKLSGNNTMSCGSCHQQKFAFTDGKAVSPGIDGKDGTRSTMSLTNILWNNSFNWDGKAKTLEEHARLPIESPIEMHQSLAQAVSKLQNTQMYPPLFLKAFGTSTITEENMLKAIAQFERTLISKNSKYDKVQAREEQFSPEEQAGFNLFLEHPGVAGNKFVRGADCNHCHGGAQFTRNLFDNNGLDQAFTDLGLGAITGKSTDNGKFRAPTLRNIALTAPYMHDGRFKTLEEVLDHYNEHVKANSPNINSHMILSTNQPGSNKLALTPIEKQQIIAFLHTLTDTEFTTDPRFSDPFAN